ncbi:MAG: cation transporter [Betaproteobacteria bacterium RIFCSPLOWO2_02_FULL_63_19]|nr:MAG: cation transporter [Betaproteobacteria bacterium RIFCSPLOWO2_02_FULL_63_19]
MNSARFDRHHFAWLSIVAAIVTISLKMFAWWVTGSVSLLADALESLVNLAGATFALWMILITRAPADAEHPFGHGKAEYFAGGFEGVLILGAAGAIVVTAVQRLLDPQPLQAIGLGLVFSMVSTAINFAVAVTLRKAGARLNSFALEADSRHLMTDVWTSLGVAAGLIVFAVSGWQWIDPVIAIAVGLHILHEGYRLVSGAVHGMMDSALVEDRLAGIACVLDAFAERDVAYKNLKTRRAGTVSFIQVDILVPRHWTVGQGHELLDEIELRLAEIVPDANIVTHLEPKD